MNYVQEKLYQQLAIDYCCTVSDVRDNRNHFTEYKKLEGRRRFEEADDCILKVIAVNGKLMFTGKSRWLMCAGRNFPINRGAGLWM